MGEEFTRLSQLYRELDEELARLRPHCRGCGECCRFDRVDHILYASELERNFLLRVTPPLLACSEESDALLISKGLRCPFQINGGCVAREGRVLGCRLHFCEGLGGEQEQDIYEEWHRRIKQLHVDLDLEWNYRPLLPLPE